MFARSPVFTRERTSVGHHKIVRKVPIVLQKSVEYVR